MNTPLKPNNPWKQMGSEPPFVLREDKPHIETFNSIHGKNEDRRINLYYTPEPRLGPVTAPLVILQLNPSWGKHEPYGPSREVISRELESIKDENYPHLGVATDNPWWVPRLRQLMNETGITKERLSQSICSIEFFPYRSVRFYHGGINLPSQSYTFGLVRERLVSGAVIIIMRGYRLWVSAVPELATQMGKTVFRTKNPQCTYITRGNLSDGLFGKICGRLSDS
jgi:hypothetical protein